MLETRLDEEPRGTPDAVADGGSRGTPDAVADGGPRGTPDAVADGGPRGTPDAVADEGRVGALASRRAIAPQPLAARTLLDVFLETARRHPGAIALDAADSRLTYAELRERAAELAGDLRELGVGVGDRVGVRISSGTAELYAAILGVLFAGAAYVPVDADDPPARAEALWRSASACVAVRDRLEITPLDDVASGQPREPSPADDAWVIFTSGSTGEPKGVAVTHGAAAAFVDAEAELFSVCRQDRVLAGLSVGFDASCEEIWLAWRHGAALIPAPRELVRAGAEFGPWIAQHGITVISTVPTLAAMWEQESLAGVRLLILGGEACPEGLGWRLARGREVWNTYGPTEATVVATAARIEPDRPVRIGWPLRGWQVAIVGPDGEPVPIGDPGELVIGGVGLGRYLDARLDAERFSGIEALGWERAYRTGDIVRETIQGLQFLGRRDDQVKLGGRRIELGEIDAKLSAVAGVRAALSAVRETNAGNRVLVGYVVGDVAPASIRAALARELPEGLVPLIVPLDSLPRGVSGKVDRSALPWPAPQPKRSEPADRLSGTAAWVAERWTDQLGPLSITADSDFFELGGTSLAAAKLVSALRERFPAVAIADVYRHRTLRKLSDRLDQLGAVDERAPLRRQVAPRRFALAHLLGVLVVRLFQVPPWLIGVLALNRLDGVQVGPRVGWGWLIAGWIVFMSVPGRAALLAAGRRLLLADLRPGRFPRHGGLALRIWLMERLAGAWRLQALEGTPWAARYARLSGHRVGRGARLFTLPPVTSLVAIGEHATVESEVELEGWWIEGEELVVGAVRVGDGARLGTHSVLMPGAQIGRGAELEPGSVVSGLVPDGERWSGSPARKIGRAGERWPADPAPAPRHARFWKLMYAVGIAVSNLIALAAVVPGFLVLWLAVPGNATAQGITNEALLLAPVLVVSFLVSYGLLVAVLVRAVAPLLRPGWHPEEGAARWALWFTATLVGATNGVLFPVYLSVYTRAWLRLLGLRVGSRAEASVCSGLSRLVSLSEASFVADAVEFATSRSRHGWMHVGPIELGAGSFLGNGAIVEGGTAIGEGCLVGVLTTAPGEVPDGTSWFGSPALELPRRPDVVDPQRTVEPPLRLVIGRGATELVRILLPATISVVLGALVFDTLEQIGAQAGALGMAFATMPVLLAAGVIAVALTVALKWLLIGRYRPGEHPLWSFFVWRDEIMNTCQEQLAGAWLISSAQATPLMSLYLRLMGARVGRDVWCDTLTITEFDMVGLRDGCVVNRHGLVETHLFHDRLLRIGPASLGEGATLGPISAILPDSAVGEETSVGARSVVMRGEVLPPRTRWHGSPVLAR